MSAVEKHLSSRFYHSIDDIVQETYIRAYRSLSRNKFRGDSSVNSWLYAIARNESLRMSKRLAREEQKFQNSVERMKITKFQNAGTNDYAIQELSEAISNLPDKYRPVLEMISQGFSEKRISDKLKIKKGTVKSRASRGREMLYKFLKGV